jgi:hypothetical protein
MRNATYRPQSNTDSLYLMLSTDPKPSVIGQRTIPRGSDAELSRVSIDQWNATDTILVVLQAESAKSQLGDRANKAAAAFYRSRSESEIGFLFAGQQRNGRASLCSRLRPSSITDGLCY